MTSPISSACRTPPALVLVVAIGAACAPVAENGSNELVGQWLVTYSPSFPSGTNGETCQTGSGSMTVSPNLTISGRVLNSAGQTITHGGAKVTGNSARGDFLINGTDVGDFTGEYADGRWSGTYEAINGCDGAWVGTRL